jgi:hypothetical protein
VDADSDSFQGPKQPGNKSSVLLVLGKSACIDVACLAKSFFVACPKNVGMCKCALLWECVHV